MCSKTWPTLLDLTKDECKRTLRNLELEAYGSIVSVFRAQGDLNKDKKRLLKDLQQILSISTERHRAEIRRAVNDEKLTTVAHCIAGSDISSEWQIEGRRLVPLMPRLVPQTAFTVTADAMGSHQAHVNQSLPHPASTGNKELAGATMAPTPLNSVGMNLGKANKVTSPPPTSNLQLFPGRPSFHVRDDVTMMEEETQLKKKRRNNSSESGALSRHQPIPTVSSLTPKTPSVPSVIHHQTPTQASPPIKISIAKSPVKHHAVSTTPSGQKVIIVSSTLSGSSSTVSTVSHMSGQSLSSGTSQKSVSAVPLVKSSAISSVTTTVNTVMYPRSSVMVSGHPSSSAEHDGRSNIITIAGSTNSSSTTHTAVYHQTLSTGTPRARVRTITARPRTPQIVRPASANMGHPPAPPSQSIHIRAATKPTIHIKQEGTGMKIITQGTPPTAGRILPKPTTPHVLVVSTAQSSVSNTRPSASGTVSASQLQGSKVLNISTSGGHILASSTPRSSGANVVTVNPKTLQLTTLKSSTSSAGTKLTPAVMSKPNVIVVQKAQAKKGSTPTVQVSRSSGPICSPFEKELVSFLQRQEPGTKGAAGPPTQRSVLERRAGRPPTAGEGNVPRKHVVVRQKTDGGRIRSVTLQGANKSSILADLIHAVNLQQESGSSAEHPVTISDDPKAANSAQSDAPQNQWFEYDVQSEGSSFTQQQRPSTKIITSESTDISTIKALLDLHTNSNPSTSSSVRRSIEVYTSLQDHGNQLTLEPVSSDTEHADPDIQIVGTSGLDESSKSSPNTQVTYIQQKQQLVNADDTESNPKASQSTYLDHQGNKSREIVAEVDPKTGHLIMADGVDTSDTEDAEDVAIQVISSEDHEAEQAALLANNNTTKTIIVNTSDQSRPREATRTTVINSNDVNLSDGNSTSAPTSGQKMDFLSNALNQAQIDLDSYQFSEEESNAQETLTESAQNSDVSSSNEAVASQPTSLVSILTPPSQGLTALQNDIDQGESQHINNQGASTSQVDVVEVQDNDLPDLFVSTLAGTPVTTTHRILTPTTPIYYKRPPQVHQKRKSDFVTTLHEADGKTFQTIHLIKPSTAVSNLGTMVSTTDVNVTTDMVSSVDTEHIHLDDLTSQTVSADIQEDVVTGAFMESAGDVAQSIRLSKRKRKAPLPADEATSPTQMGWTRFALGILQRVTRVRGSYKEKGEMNAASWFTQPVDPREVPDYYTIIEHPMDFATIKKKLEVNQYVDIEEFHSDMLLVRDNCHRYNPAGTEVRRDCDEVFSVYAAEYDKAMNRWQQGHISSPNSKKGRSDRSPIRH